MQALLCVALILLVVNPPTSFSFPLEKPPGYVTQAPATGTQTLSLYGVSIPVGSTVSQDSGKMILPTGEGFDLWQLQLFGPIFHDFTFTFLTYGSFVAIFVASVALLLTVGRKRKLKFLKVNLFFLLLFFTVYPHIPSLSVRATTPALDTSGIATLAYWQPAGSLTLNKTLTTYINYTWGGNYIDGYIRVWQSATVGLTSIVTNDAWVDIPVRVRADGWILAWIKTVHSAAPSGTSRCFLFYFGYGYTSAGCMAYSGATYPPINMTTLARAVEVITTAHGGITFNRNSIKYYDYQLTQSTRMFMFGAQNVNNWYITIPYGVTVDRVYITHVTQVSDTLSIDGTTIDSVTSIICYTANKRSQDSGNTCRFFNATATITWTVGTQHVVTVSGSVAYCGEVIIMFSH